MDSENQNATEKPEKEFLYEGNKVPKLLRSIYVLFLVWAVSYFLFWLMPDLIEWLK